MKRHCTHGFGCGFGFPPFGFRFWGPWFGRAWGRPFPRRGEYLRMLEEYKEELEDLQREIAGELEQVNREIEELGRK